VYTVEINTCYKSWLILHLSLTGNRSSTDVTFHSEELTNERPWLVEDTVS